MRSAGLDIGSRTVKLVVLDGDRPVFESVVPNTHDPLAVCRELLAQTFFDTLTTTGYGRHLLAAKMDCGVITEIRAVAVGARHLYPDCRAVLDIGGQDTKALRIAAQGGVDKFEMNDKCAAGTGRFLEIMATALGWTPDEFRIQASAATGESAVSAMCTVFAESEVVSALARGTDRAQLARGIHAAVAERASSLCRRVGIDSPVLFCGGVSNRFLGDLVSARLGLPVYIPERPQTVAALGAALAGRR